MASTSKSPGRTSESERVLADALAEALNTLGRVDYGAQCCQAILTYLDRSPRAKRILRAAHARLLLDMGWPQDEVGRMLSEDASQAQRRDHG